MFKLIIFNLTWLILINIPLSENLTTDCVYGTENGIYFADCRKNYLEQFPKDLKESVEGLYLSWNNIRTLTNSTFQPYTSIKFLYLDRNQGMVLESQTFEPLTKLNTLDLSYNPYLNISNLYFPTSLKKLYLSGIRTIATQLPISSLRELTYLTLSECELSEVPSFGGNLPSLETLNLTVNKLEEFKIDNLAFLCQLKKLYISENVSIRNNCECLRIRKWLEDQSITGSLLSCKKGNTNHEDCDLSPSASFLKIFDLCKTDVITKKFLNWFLIGCISFLLFFSCILLYVCCNTKGLFYHVICCRFCCKKR